MDVSAEEEDGKAVSLVRVPENSKFQKSPTFAPKNAFLRVIEKNTKTLKHVLIITELYSYQLSAKHTLKNWKSSRSTKYERIR